MLELQSRHCFSFVFSGRSLLVDKRIDVLNRPTRKSCEKSAFTSSQINQIFLWACSKKMFISMRSSRLVL